MAPTPQASDPRTVAYVGLAALASAMGIGRFAFTPLLPLMQQEGLLTLSEGASLAAANYLGYLLGAVACMLRPPRPQRAAVGGLVVVAPLTAGMALTASHPAWLALRLVVGVASAYVLVGVSAWALPRLAAAGRPSWSGRLFSGVGAGILLAGLVGLVAGGLRRDAAEAWLLLGGLAFLVALVAMATMDPAGGPVTATASPPSAPLLARGWRAALAYGAFGFGYVIPATFLPAAARQLIPDPSVFGWTWPVVGLAALISTLVAARGPALPPRAIWSRAQGTMAVGVLAPALHLSLATLLLSAVLLGGTFMVVTMAGMQEARELGGEAAPRLMAALTAAFALGQLAGPFTVRLLPSAGASLALPLAASGVVLLLGVVALPRPPRAAPSRAPQP